MIIKKRSKMKIYKIKFETPGSYKADYVELLVSANGDQEAREMFKEWLYSNMSITLSDSDYVEMYVMSDCAKCEVIDSDMKWYHY